MKTETYTDVFSGYEVFYRRNGQKLSKVVFGSRDNAVRARRQLKRNRRKFLGFRPVQIEVVTSVTPIEEAVTI